MIPRASSSLFVAAALLVCGCRSKNDDPPIEIPLPSQSDPAGQTEPAASPQPGASATARSVDPKRAAPSSSSSSSSSSDVVDPSRSGAPTAKPKASGRPISTQL